MKSHRFVITTIGIVVVIILSVIMLYNYLQPRTVANQFLDAIDQHDIEAIDELLYKEDGEIIVNDQLIEGFLTYLESNETSYDEMEEDLEEQIKTRAFTTGEEQIRLIETMKIAGIFPVYEIKITPVNIRIKGQKKEDTVNVIVDQSENPLPKIEKDSHLYGSILPGTHQVEAVIKNELGLFNKKKELDIWDEEEISLLVDHEKLAAENDGIQRDLVNAVNTFNIEMFEYITAYYETDNFSNITEDFRERLMMLYYLDILNEDVTRLEQTIVNLDELSLLYFDQQWQAKVEILVLYTGYNGTYSDLCHVYLDYDNQNKQWLIDNIKNEEVDESVQEEWDNKRTFEIKDDVKEHHQTNEVLYKPL